MSHLPSHCPDWPVPLAMPYMRIGLLGGSFDPPHQGHIDISLTAVKRMQLDQLWWLVSPGNPLKHQPLLLPERVSQCQAMTAVYPTISVTAFEACGYGGGPYYSIHAISWLKQRFTQTCFVWIMGADNLVDFHKWYRWEDIFCHMPVAIMDRPEERLKAMNSQAVYKMDKYRKNEHDVRSLPEATLPAWSFLSLPLNPVSSTQLRQLKTGETT